MTEEKTNRRQLIIESAKSLFAKQGFDATSFGAVAQLADVKKSLVQYHFENKDILWKETIATVWQQRNDALPRYLDDVDFASQTDSNMLRDLCRQLLAFTFDHPEWINIMFQESAAPSPRLDWMIETFLKKDYAEGEAIVALAQQQGHLPNVNAVDLLHILSGALFYLVNVAPISQRVLGVDPSSTEYMNRHVDSLMAILMTQTASLR